MQKFFRNVNVVGGLIPGSNMHKLLVRKEIYSMIPFYGPPTFFFTINPRCVSFSRVRLCISLCSDLYSPICAWFVGSDVKIRLTDPDRTRLPDFHRRAVAVSRDQFFDLVVRAFLRCLLGYQRDVETVPLAERLGVIGDIPAYYAVSEHQNRGTLHLHGVCWSSGALRPAEFAARLKAVGPEGDAFRLRVLRFWDEVIRESVPGAPVTDMKQRDYRWCKWDPLVINGREQVCSLVLLSL